ncbi:MAG: phenylalanine--tRNA ligase subunit beta [Flavipsychrobacter sp.]|nr:phenylalanine--tRNA ligase subunit beta [Flavipsychrobacter sp.]
MIISYKWLLDYLPQPLPVNELSKILTSIGLEVEAVENIEAVKGGLEGLLTGEVLTCEKHPNADKLKVTTVNIGGAEPLHIVCGAPNVAAGQKVIVAPVGAMVHPTNGSPFLIKKAKIRGEDSEGMICAEDEIGLGESHAGIMILPADTKVGLLAKDYFKLPETDHAIHIGLTPNRSDAMSHIGVARDVCAYLTHHTGTEHVVKLPAASLSLPATPSRVTVTIQAAEACPRYTGISITGVKVGPSPEWLQQRLKTIEVRSINNIVDITNYVLHEYGQPLHAFDEEEINGSTINVGFVAADTLFTTLDDKERKLRSEDLMIMDGSGPVAIAGVFGGLHSGVTPQTASIFLESAYFTPVYVRRTSMHHGLRTDAATHFEKGVDINNVIPALQRAASLIAELAGGTVSSSITDVYPQPLEQVQVKITYSYIQKLSGKYYSPESVKNILTALGFGIEEETADSLYLSVPSNKTDVKQPADIVEEILRIDGLDNIVIPQKLNIDLIKALPTDRDKRETVADILHGLGFQEIVTNSIVNSKYYPGDTKLVHMLNSLSSDLDVMRPTMLESGLEVIQYNYNRKNKDLRLFEFGRIYQNENSKYIEYDRLGIWITGNIQQAQWNQKARPADIFYVKGVISDLLQRSGIDGVQPVYAQEGNELQWKYKNAVICTAQAIDQKRLDIFDIKQDTYFVNILWQEWTKAMAQKMIRYKEVSKYPAVQRDLAIILDKTTGYGDVVKQTEQLKLGALTGINLFDVFESEKLGADKKSYAVNYSFQLQDRTLTDAEIEEMMQQLVTTYKTKLNAQIRD